MAFIETDTSYRFSVTLIVKVPYKIKIHTKDFMGRSVFTMLVIGPELSYLDYRDATLYKGNLYKIDSNRFLPQGLDVISLTSFFAGGLFPVSVDQASVVQDQPGEIRIEASYSRANHALTVYLDSTEMFLTGFDIAEDDEKVLEVRYSDHKKINGLWVPFRLNLKNLENQSELNMVYTDFKTNLDKGADLFKLTVPENVKIINIED